MPLPTRIKLLLRLQHGEATVTQLTPALGATQQNASKHLRVLERYQTIRGALEETRPRRSRRRAASAGSG